VRDRRMVADMRFYHPWILYLLLIVPLILAAMILWDRRVRVLLRRFGEDSLVQWTRVAPPAWVTRLARGLLLLVFSLLILALARPQWGEKVEEVRRKGLDIYLVLDVSASMDAADIKPSRLEAARGEITAFLELLQGDRVGLICFSGEPALICPLTTDDSALKIFLDSADTSTISRPGTAIAAAIQAAIKAFDPVEKRYRLVILLTDGEDHEGQVMDAARKARDEGVTIYTIGIGTETGELVPVRDQEGQFREWKKDDAGQVVQTRLDAGVLQEVATLTGGTFFAMTSGGGELKTIAEEIAAMDKKEVRSRMRTTYEERYQWFLLPALAALFVAGSLPVPRLVRRRRQGEG